MKRVALVRRRLWRRSSGPREDAVSPELVEALWKRDRGCVLAQVEPGHECRDRWSIPHAFDRRDLITVEHVKDELAMGKRAPSDLDHCVLLCATSNIGVPSKERRALLRAWLETHR